QRPAVAGQHRRQHRAAAAAQRLGERPDLERRAGDAVHAEPAAGVAGDRQRRLVAATGTKSTHQAEHAPPSLSLLVDTRWLARCAAYGQPRVGSGVPAMQSEQFTVAFCAVDVDTLGSCETDTVWPLP